MDSSPCKNCEHILENKKTFPECVNCVKRFGGQTHFLPHKKLKYKPCKWPHGCTNKVVTAEYCTRHKMIISGRLQYWKGKLFGDELQAKLFAPVNERRGNPNSKLAATKGAKKNDGTKKHRARSKTQNEHDPF